MNIIGLSGTNGSGKDTLGQLLAEQYGYLFVSVTELLRDEARRRGLPVDRESLRTISAEWRREYGLGVLVDRAVARYREHPDAYTGVVMASLRNPGEIDRLHELGGTLVWIDADPQIRYARIQANVATRGRAEEDNKTFEQFLAEEAAEMRPTGDKATLNMEAVKAMTDVTIMNNGSELTELQQNIEQVLHLQKPAA